MSARQAGVETRPHAWPKQIQPTASQASAAGDQFHFVPFFACHARECWTTNNQQTKRPQITEPRGFHETDVVEATIQPNHPMRTTLRPIAVALLSIATTGLL